jgi:hypothetical protein
MAINERLIHTAADAAGAGTGNQEEGLILHLDANDVDSYDGDGTVWYDIKDHEYTPATNADEHFNTVTYTGASAPHVINTVGFQPDLIWIKNRDTTDSYAIVDSVRGITSPAPYLASDQSAAQATSTNMPTSVQPEGFTITGNGGRTNTIGEDYVAWCFKAGGAAVLNEEGDIDSQVSVNNDLGFSIVSYTGNSSFGQTVGHGLDVQPQMVIYKNRSNERNWRTYVEPLGATKYINLDESAGEGTYGSFNNTAPTSTVFSTTNSVADRATNFNGDNYIAYCFASKRGVSKVGSYTGNGSTTGPIVYLGFEPAFLMFKCSSQVGNWIVIDNKRATSNPRTPHLRANSNSADDSGTNEYVDFLGNGFQPKGVSNYNNNSSGQTYIYYAVAKNTKETSLIPDTDLELHLDAASFDGSTNTPSTWTDSSGNGNNGTISGATFDSELGNWLDFDGTSDYITVNSSAINLSTDSTVEGWFNPDNLTALDHFFSIYDLQIASDRKFFLRLNNTSGDIEYYGYDSQGQTVFSIVTSNPSVKIVANKWNHIVTTHINNGTVAIYINGELAGSTTYTGSINTSGSGLLHIGTLNDYIGSYDFDGKVGQVRFYNNALTQDQIRQNYNFTKNNYPNGFDGTITGATWYAGGYFDFNGSNQYVTLPFNTTLNEFSFHAWVRPDSTTGDYHTILGKWWDGSNRSFFLTGINQILKVDIAYTDSNTDNIFGTTSLPDLTWSFVCVTWKNYEGLTLTVNDTTETFSINKAIRSNTNSWYIGNQDSRLIKMWDGKISKCKMYDKKLSSTEITEIFNDTKSAYGL